MNSLNSSFKRASSFRRKSSKHDSKTGSKRLNSLQSVSSRVSVRFGFENPEDEDQKNSAKFARLDFRTYLPDANLTTENSVLTGQFNVRVLKTTKTGAVSRWSKFKGTVSLGNGKFKMDLKKAKARNSKTVSWTFDVGLLKNIGYKRKGIKEFSLTFHNNDNLVNILTDTAETAEQWLTAIFAEIRVQATVFNHTMVSLLEDNPVWKKLLRINTFDNPTNSIDAETTEAINALSDADKQKLVVDEDVSNMLEICLREEADLYRLCRGPFHPDVLESYERLAIWLKGNLRREESSYWAEMARKGRIEYGYRMKHEMNPAESTMKVFEDSALEEIRNPSGMHSLAALSAQRLQNSKVDIPAMVDQMKEALKNMGAVVDVKDSNYDPFEDML